MPVKQYLFRLHMRPIADEGRVWTDVFQDEIILNLNQIELDTVDFVCSLPEATADLAQQATMLAYAQAVIAVRSYIWMVVVFELRDDRGADNTTPVIILHPFLSPNLKPQEGTLFNSILLVKRDWETPQEAIEARTGIADVGRAFASYQLHGDGIGQNAWQQMPDPFTVANIARDVVKGRYQLQYLKRAIAPEDYFIDHDAAYFLNLKGTLARTRFAFWRAAVESLPFGHAGYRIDKQAKLIPQATALTRRALNGVTNMAQQRRQFVRRDFAINVVLREWVFLCEQFLAWMWRNDEAGIQTPIVYGTYRANEAPLPDLVATDVPWQWLNDALPWLIYWLNLVNVAQGDNGLIISLPDQTEAELQSQYDFVLDRLRGPDGLVNRYILREITAHVEVFRHMVDLTRSIIADLLAYRTELEFYRGGWSEARGMTFLQWQNARVTSHNNLAVKWPGLVADFYSVFCLACTWQLTFDPLERTRGEDSTDVLRSKKPDYVQEWKRPFTPITKWQLSIDLNMDGRFGREYPIFAPFRTWDVNLYATNYDQVLLEDLENRRQAAFQAWLNDQQQLELLRQQAANEAWEAYKAEKKAEWIRLNLPNPDDPWDYENYTSYQWWVQKSQEPMNVEFALRSLDVPNELFTYSGIALEAARQYIPYFNQDKPPDTWNEKNEPAATKRYVVDWPAIILRVRNLTPGELPYAVFEIVGDEAGRVADALGTNDETYRPRQFWPPITFNW